jgi:hypothetical protein
MGVLVCPEIFIPVKLLQVPVLRKVIPVNYLQLTGVFVILLLSTVSIAPFLFHPPVILKELVRLEEKVYHVVIPKVFNLGL